MDNKVSLYAKCDNIKRTEHVHEVNEELTKQLASSFELLPLFEKGLFEHNFMKHYSLQSNELLKCRWKEYVRNIESRVFAPFQFPDIRDLHFYNGAVRLHPSATITRQEHRMKQKPGPGVDYAGQMPIPQEALMKRGGKTTSVSVRAEKKAGNEKARNLPGQNKKSNEKAARNPI